MSDELAIREAAKGMLDRYAAMNQASREQRKLAAKPEVGIVFLFEGHLWIKGEYVDDAKVHGDFKGQGSCHDEYWSQLQRIGSVPRTVEYDEVPRGRVGYNVKNRTYYLFLDKCIMENQRMVDKIFSYMHLPSQGTKVQRDSHYVCPGCKKKSKEQLKQEEEDSDF